MERLEVRFLLASSSWTRLDSPGCDIAIQADGLLARTLTGAVFLIVDIVCSITVDDLALDLGDGVVDELGVTYV